MTVAQARALPAKLPRDAPLCFCADDAGQLVEMTQIEVVPAASEDEYFVAAFDAAANDEAIKFPVVA